MHERLAALRGRYAGAQLYIIGKGPSLRGFAPFDEFRDKVCIGINNVYQYFPGCSYSVMWHREFFANDADYLRKQQDFFVVYSSFHGFPENEIENGVNVEYAAEFPLPDQVEGTVAYWRESPDRWMYKSTYATAVRLAWWMGAKRITMAGFDFSLDAGRTAQDDVLDVPVKLRNYTVEQILALQAVAYRNLHDQLAQDGVLLERIFPADTEPVVSLP